MEKGFKKGNLIGVILSAVLIIAGVVIIAVPASVSVNILGGILIAVNILVFVLLFRSGHYWTSPELIEKGKEEDKLLDKWSGTESTWILEILLGDLFKDFVKISGCFILRHRQVVEQPVSAVGRGRARYFSVV